MLSYVKYQTVTALCLSPPRGQVNFLQTSSLLHLEPQQMNVLEKSETFFFFFKNFFIDY